MPKPVDVSSPLNPATVHILLALAGQDLHGYGIMLEIERQSEGGYQLGPGTLYDNLKRLMDAGLVVDSPKTNRQETRRLYRLTDDGKTVLKAEVARLDKLVSDAKSVLAARRPRRV